MDSKFYKQIGDAVKRAELTNGDLTSKNLTYVWKVAEDVSRSTGVDVEELYMEGVIEMKKREAKYDPLQNDSFVKYCSKSIRSVMMNFVNREAPLVHIPANHQKGFKKGQEGRPETNISYKDIDADDYDTLGFDDDSEIAEQKEMFEILKKGLDKLDPNGRTAISMKLRLGKWGETIPSEDNPGKYIYKYKNDKKSIAEELEVPLNMANKIYKSALDKLTKYCQGMTNA